MLDLMTPHQKRMLMELLIAIAKSDGKVGEIENEAIMDYAELLDVGLEELSGAFNIAELAPHFDTPASRVAAMQELCRLARLDGHFARPEQQAILDVGERMGLSHDMITRIDHWVLEGLHHTARGEDLLAEAERALV